ncbi:MAG: hypothetical protein HOV81_25405 [Kofleriaceae bacterium]|nr:hypothetical protein [Kofleriaceae bacterium]
MSFLEALRRGAYGVTLQVPESFEVLSDDESANVLDRENATVWYFFSAPSLELDLSPDRLAGQQRDAKSYAQQLFDDTRTKDLPPSNGRGVFLGCEQVRVDGQPALSVLHRMSYEPGREILMGHLLVPTGEGLFEARWLTRDNLTGMRETLLLDKALAANPGAKVEELGPTVDYDDPKHDEAFPKHALSRARAAERWIREDAGLRVTAPARPFAAGEAVLADLGCALVPPPGFARQAANKRFALFSRVSLAVTDGLHYFSVQRRRDGNVAQAVEDRTRDLIRADKMLATSVATIPAPSGADACVVGEAERGESSTARYVTVGVRDGSGSAVMTIICTRHDPVDDMVAELAASARTFRVAKPWWKIW